jgi:hypothetical protein
MGKYHNLEGIITFVSARPVPWRRVFSCREGRDVNTARRTPKELGEIYIAECMKQFEARRLAFDKDSMNRKFIEIQAAGLVAVLEAANHQ